MFTLNEINGFVHQSVQSLSFKSEVGGLYEPVKYTLSLGGKRMRPMLTLLVYNMFNDTIGQNVLFPAMAIEAFHNFTLIHDDIMDNSDMRRHQPSVYKKWNVNQAILSGDALCIKAYEYILRCAPEVLPHAMELFNCTALQVCEGQQLDMDYEKEWCITEEEYLQMIALKTAVLVACACKMGAICAGASSQDANSLYKVGYSIGMGFQIKDDILDSYGSVEFGKPKGGDIVNNKKSWLMVYALRKAPADIQQKLRDLLMDKTLNEQEKIDKVISIYDAIGVREAAEAKVEEYYNEALQILSAIDVADNKKAALKDYILQLLNRVK